MVPLKKPIRLDRNENPLGPNPLAIKAAQQAVNSHRYPNRQVKALEESLALRLGVHPQTITLGNGSEGL